MIVVVRQLSSTRRADCAQNRRYLVTAKLPVFRELPVINADSTVTTGQMISSLEGGSQVHAEIIEPGPHESPLVLRARLLDPLQGFVIAATWQRELLSPTARHLDQFGGVRCTFSAASLSAVLGASREWTCV